jgi:hypothetical protein
MSYSQRRNTMSKRDIAAMSKWAAARPRTGEATITQKQRDLWDALNSYVMERGAAIVSAKYANPVRLEIPVDSPLPDKLRGLGYDLIFRSEETRIGAPIAEHALWGQRSNRNNAYSFRAVTVLELRLPK